MDCRAGAEGTPAHGHQDAQGRLQQGLRLLHRGHQGQRCGVPPITSASRRWSTPSSTPDLKGTRASCSSAEERIAEQVAFAEICQRVASHAAALLATARSPGAPRRDGKPFGDCRPPSLRMRPTFEEAPILHVTGGASSCRRARSTRALCPQRSGDGRAASTSSRAPIWRVSPSFCARPAHHPDGPDWQASSRRTRRGSASIDRIFTASVPPAKSLRVDRPCWSRWSRPLAVLNHRRGAC